MASAFTSKKHSPRPKVQYPADANWNPFPHEPAELNSMLGSPRIDHDYSPSRSILKHPNALMLQSNGQLGLQSHNGNQLSWVDTCLSNDDYAQAYEAFERSKSTHGDFREIPQQTGYRQENASNAHHRPKLVNKDTTSAYTNGDCAGLHSKTGHIDDPQKSLLHKYRVVGEDRVTNDEQVNEKLAAQSVSSSMNRSISPAADCDQPVLFTSFIHPLKPSPRANTWVAPSCKPTKKSTRQSKTRTHRALILNNQSKAPSHRALMLNTTTPQRVSCKSQMPLPTSARTEKLPSSKAPDNFPSFKISFTSSGKLACHQVEHPGAHIGLGNTVTRNNARCSTINTNLYRQALSSRSHLVTARSQAGTGSQENGPETPSSRAKQSMPTIGSVGAEIRRTPQDRPTRQNFPIIRSKTCHMFRKSYTHDVTAEGAGLASDIWRTRHDNTPACATAEEMVARVYPRRLVVSMPTTEDSTGRLLITEEFLLNSPDSGLE